MVSDEYVVEQLYIHDSSYLTMTCDLWSGELLESELHTRTGCIESVNLQEMNRLLYLQFLLEIDSKEDRLNNRVILKYQLSKSARSMLDTVKKYKILRYKNINKYSYLDVAKVVTILSHAGRGMVDFTYNGIDYTVRMKTPYDFFVEQYKLSKRK